MRKTGLSAASAGKRGEKFEINEELFKTFKENNITAMEVSMPFGVDFFNLDFVMFDELSEKYGVDLWSYHIPFSDFYDLSTAYAKDTLTSIKMLVDRASRSGVKYIVTHPCTEIVDSYGREKRMENAKKNLNELCLYCNEKGLGLAVEDLPRLCLGNCAEEMIELIELNPNLKVCFDVNHIAQGTQVEFVRKLKDRIATVHIADYKIPDNHLLPFNGEVDWKALINALNEINYTGPFLFEAGRFKGDGEYYPMSIYRELHEKIEALAQ